MPDLDRKRILQGTPNKIIRLAHETMKNDYTTESAKTFYDVYSKYDLPVILEASRYIFSEPEFGLPYYKEIMESGCIPFHCYAEERDKVHSYLESFEDKMNDTTKDLYKSLYEFVDKKFNDHKSSLVVECRIEADDDTSMKFCSEAFKYLKNPDSFRQREFLESAFQNLNDYEKILYCLERVSDLNLESELGLVVNKIYNESCGDSIDAYSENMHLTGIMNFMSNDKCMKESVEKIHNAMTQLNVKGLMLESACDMMEDAMISNITPHQNLDIDDTKSFVSWMFESSIDGTSDYMESVDGIEVYDNYIRKYIGYNDAYAYIMAESVYMDENDTVIAPDIFKEYCEMNGYDASNMSIHDAEILISEAVSELENQIYLMEYSNDGTQTAVIRNHATNMREGIIPPKDKKPQQSEEWKKNLNEEKDDDDDEDDDVNDALQISGEESGDTSVKDVSAKGKPVMPKQSLHQKIQAKALDADVAATNGASKVRSGITNVVQTGKAVLRVPGHVVTSLKSFLDGWKNMDENARKEAMLKPGYRKKFFKKLRSAIVYGVTWSIHPYLAIAAWFCKRASKEKNQYIRNELAMELQTEIKVCEEKIEDAKNKDDQKEKYRLMRIRDKLDKERVRVISNAKYI